MDGCTETYHDVKRLIYQLCWGNVKRFGGDWHEYLSIANEAYMRAFETYNMDKGAFTTWVHWCVTNALRSFQRQRRVKAQRTQVATDLEVNLDHARSRERFDLVRFLGSLTEDAFTVTKMALEAPGEMVYALTARQASDIRGSLWHKVKEIGWTPARLLEAMDEVREALFT
jgi:DNA-directed RNA polymerase specialized sigma24 family protein